jgi:large subunit ribosomal protein L15
LEEKFDKGAEINPALLYEYGLLKKKKLPVKILGDGNLTKKFIVKAQAFSKSAVDKIKSCGGKIDTL